MKYLVIRKQKDHFKSEVIRGIKKIINFNLFSVLYHDPA